MIMLTTKKGIVILVRYQFDVMNNKNIYIYLDMFSTVHHKIMSVW